MTDYNLGRVVGTDGVGIQSIITPLEADGRRRVEITLTNGTVERFWIEKGTKGDTGTGIRTIELISTVGKDKNYRITFTDNTTFDYTISDGEDAVCDTELDIDSENAVQNKVITGTINTINSAMDLKYDKNDVLQLLIDYGLVRTANTADSVVLAGDKEILSYVDGDILTLSATVYDEDNNVVPNKKVVFYKDEIVLDTRYTDANGVATYEYTSEGVGDLRFEASVGSLLSETYEVEDCVDVISGETDQTSKFGSSIGLRNNGTSTISHDSTNKYYSVNITKSNSESFIPINSATGLDNVVIEFDGYLPISGSFLGFCFYKENSNWGRLGARWDTNGSKFEYGGNTNGSYAESDISGYVPPTTTWLHHKFTITNDTIHRQVYNGTTLIYEDTRTYTDFFTSTTKYGFSALWTTGWKQYFKNIKIKPL